MNYLIVLFVFFMSIFISCADEEATVETDSAVIVVDGGVDQVIVADSEVMDLTVKLDEEVKTDLIEEKDLITD